MPVWDSSGESRFKRLLDYYLPGTPTMSGSLVNRRLEIFVPSLDRPFVLGSTEGTFNLWHLYQTAPNGGWSYWKDLGAPRPGVVGVWGGPAVGSAADGRLEVFVRGSDGHLWYRYQTPPRHLSSGYQTFGDWSDWEDLSVYPRPRDGIDKPRVGRAADGRLEIFALDGDPAHLWHLYHTSPNGGWSDWKDLGVPRPAEPDVPISSIYWLQGVGLWLGAAVGSAADGRLEVFVPGIDGHLWHLYQTSPNGGWSDWEDLGVPRPG